MSWKQFQDGTTSSFNYSLRSAHVSSLGDLCPKKAQTYYTFSDLSSVPFLMCASVWATPCCKRKRGKGSRTSNKPCRFWHLEAVSVLELSSHMQGPRNPWMSAKVPETQSCQSVQSVSKCGGPSRVRRPRRGHSPPNVSSKTLGRGSGPGKSIGCDISSPPGGS